MFCGRPWAPTDPRGASDDCRRPHTHREEEGGRRVVGVLGGAHQDQCLPERAPAAGRCWWVPTLVLGLPEVCDAALGLLTVSESPDCDCLTITFYPRLPQAIVLGPVLLHAGGSPTPPSLPGTASIGVCCRATGGHPFRMAVPVHVRSSCRLLAEATGATPSVAATGPGNQHRAEDAVRCCLGADQPTRQHARLLICCSSSLSNPHRERSQ